MMRNCKITRQNNTLLFDSKRLIKHPDLCEFLFEEKNYAYKYSIESLETI